MMPICALIDDKIMLLEKDLGAGKVAAQVMPFQKFWEGEGYHQDYEKLHPSQSYIRNVSVPRLNKFKAKFSQLLKEDGAH